MFRKVFAALCLAGLATLCAGQLYVVEFKPFPCDFEMHANISLKSTELAAVVKYHGKYSIQTSLAGISLTRPDLGTESDGQVFMASVAGTEDECFITTMEPLGNLGTRVFTHKDEDVVNGKECIKYHNNTGAAIWADAEGNPIARTYFADLSFVSAIFVRPETEFSRETFVLPKDYTCTEKREVFKAPSKKAYNAACEASTPSSAGMAGMHKLVVLCAFVAVLLLL